MKSLFIWKEEIRNKRRYDTLCLYEKFVYMKNFIVENEKFVKKEVWEVCANEKTWEVYIIHSTWVNHTTPQFDKDSWLTTRQRLVTYNNNTVLWTTHETTEYTVQQDKDPWTHVTTDETWFIQCLPTTTLSSNKLYSNSHDLKIQRQKDKKH